ncbi:uncharacterized protein PGTG_07646 [Puccinia graminis f. sp. tritici CRL 75-36-700-3]|uniref:CCHC-type domain-containing protein n=1 Tax=Puccinia graminis f. sp. tritici (strain CRL 75-36-700-3 / race SCCL) TaxID=418459 RepID=E3KCW3_PUCGT|nr:uncharacterized protein PGTG_07646 [Puccinia graminis f. sp. tritici CRL 75-36-700-3]EFP82249.2 hypothetical protein PGTG_07646 [Puccinia graminis f. sp. tritici CRL 75-36-700-3]
MAGWKETLLAGEVLVPCRLEGCPSSPCTSSTGRASFQPARYLYLVDWKETLPAVERVRMRIRMLRWPEKAAGYPDANRPSLIVTGKLLRPETDYKDKDSKPVTQGSHRLYYAEESASDWDVLLDIARATLKMTLSVDLAMRYKDTKPVSLLFKTICDAYEKNTRARRMMLQDAFWTACHDPSNPIATWIARVRNLASDLKSVRLTPADQQICDRLLRGLDKSWKPIRDHLVYSPNEISLDDAIGALEAHEVSMQAPFDQPQDTFAALAVARKKKPGCWNCGEFGHHSSLCPNLSVKNKSKAKFGTRAGAASAVALGGGGPSD